MIIYIIVLAAIAGILLGILIAIILRQRSNKTDGNLMTKLANDALRSNNEQFLLLAKQVLENQKTDIKTDLEGKKSNIAALIEEIRKDIRRNEERLSQSDTERVRSFSALQKELEDYKKITGEIKISADKLKSMLSNNQMRGAFGEQVAEDLLKMAGFVIGQDYFANKAQESATSRPDFTIFLPDKTKINIDVKFPYTNLVKSVESENEEEKKRYFQAFRTDVRNKIKQVTSREYINPQDKTVDFVILFIPNEMIFSYIYEKMNDVWEDAMRKKVVLAGPFSFTAILRMVRQAYTNFRYQKNLHNIIGLIHQFDDEYQKYSESVDKLGKQIHTVSEQYSTITTTRNRKLTTVVDKIKTQNVIDNPEPLTIENHENQNSLPR